MSTVFASITTPGPPGPSGRTALWIVSVGPPVTAQGLDGDMFLNSTTGDVYGPKAGVWGGVVANIKGSTGVAGPTGPAGYSPRYLVAAGPPATITGNDGDMYLNSSTNDLYGPKTAGAWGGVIANIKGATGPAGAPGAPGAPGVAYTPKGAWSPTVPAIGYTQGDMVSDAGIAYISLLSGNLGHTPLSSPTWWQAVAAGGTQTPWQSDIDGNTHILKNAGTIGVGNDLSVLPFVSAAYAVIAGGSSATPGRIVVASNQPVGAAIGVFSFANYGISAAEKRICQIAGFTDTTIDSGTLAFQTANAGVMAERMRITPTGNVGIGTMSPAYPLAIHTFTNGNLGVRNFPTTNYTQLFTYSDDGSVYRPFQIDALPLILNSISGGNVGIGTIPLTVFHAKYSGGYTSAPIVQGSTQSCLQFVTATGVAGSGYSLGRSSAGDDSQDFWLYDTQAGAFRFYISSAGNFGIGTLSPVAKLHVSAPNNVDSNVTYNGPATFIFDNAGVQLAMGTALAGPYGFWMQSRLNQSNAHILAINPQGGNVGIGTAAPLHQLTVLGACVATSTINTSAAMGGIISLDDSGGSSGSGGAVLFGANSGVWRFAAIKGMVVNGTANSQGELAFCLRLAETDTTLTEVMRITSTACVGIGTGNPLNKFSIITSVLATAASANQLTIGEVSNNPNYRLSLGYFIDGSSYKGAIQSTNSGPALGTLCLQPLGGTTGIGTIAPRGTVEISSPNTGVLKNVLLLAAPRSFTPAADGLFISATGGTLGSHDYGAIVMKSDPSTGDGAGAIVELHCGGTSSLHTFASRFLMAFGSGGSTPMVNILQLHSNGTTRLQCDSSGTTIFGDCNISGSYLMGGSVLTIDATQIVSGLIFPGRLGSGTANSSTYLRGDGVWGAAAGSGLSNMTNQTGGRALGTIYTNTTKPIWVMVNANMNANSILIAQSNLGTPSIIVAQTPSLSGSNAMSIGFWVLPSHSFKVWFSAGGGNINTWYEYD